MFPGMITLFVAAAGAFVAGIVVATYFDRSRTSSERANFEKSSKTMVDQLTNTRARLDEALRTTLSTEPPLPGSKNGTPPPSAWWSRCG